MARYIHLSYVRVLEAVARQAIKAALSYRLLYSLTHRHCLQMASSAAARVVSVLLPRLQGPGQIDYDLSHTTDPLHARSCCAI